MINIDKFKTFFYTVANKNGRGTLTPSQFNSLVSQGVMAWYNKKMGARDGNGLNVSITERNQQGIEDLNEIKEERPLLSTLGEVLIPNGTTYDLNGEIAPTYWTFANLGYKYFCIDKDGNKSVVDRPIEIVKDNEWLKRTSSTIIAPDMKRPIARFVGVKLQVRPKVITNVNLTYYRYPNTPKWGYTLINNRPVYDSSTSTNIEAGEDAFNEIAMITLGLLGINLREQDLVQYATLNENKGI